MYCNKSCQKANWDEHKISCNSSLLYILEQVLALHKTQQWRKLLARWATYLDTLLNVANEDRQRVLLTIFKEANQMGSNTTNDSGYATAAIPILLKLIDLDGKQELFETQGLHLCELGQSYRFTQNDQQEMACYLRACDIGDEHKIATAKCAGNHGVGRIFVFNKRLLEAKPLLRIALEVAESGDTDWMKQHALVIGDELCDVLFKLNAVDEVGPIVKRFPKLLKKSMGPSSPRLQYDMRCFILLARFFEANNKPDEAAGEIYKMLSLIEANKESVHDFRPLFLHILDQAIENLRILDDTDVGNFELAKKVYLLIDQQRRKDARW
jgi:hypothetical protein